MTTNEYRTSALFSCNDCKKEWQDLKNARERAYQHAKHTGHFVRGEICIAYHYKNL